jgi:hypothetical protein
MFPEDIHRTKFATSIFHSYVHEWECQLKYNPRYNVGWGMSDGEGLERLWSYLSALVSPLRYATRNHRLNSLHHQSIFHNAIGIERLSMFLNSQSIVFSFLTFQLSLYFKTQVYPCICPSQA